MEQTKGLGEQKIAAIPYYAGYTKIYRYQVIDTSDKLIGDTYDEIQAYPNKKYLDNFGRIVTGLYIGKDDDKDNVVYFSEYGIEIPAQNTIDNTKHIIDPRVKAICNTQALRMQEKAILKSREEKRSQNRQPCLPGF